MCVQTTLLIQDVQLQVICFHLLMIWIWASPSVYLVVQVSYCYTLFHPQIILCPISNQHLSIEEQQLIREILTKMKQYFESEVLCHPEYAHVRGRW